MLNPWRDFLDYEAAFDTDGAIRWAQEHTDFPIFCVAAYLAFIFYAPALLEGREPLKLRRTWALWNLLLSLFSTVGVSRTLPVLVDSLRTHGYRYTVCEPAQNWFLGSGACGLWVTCFIFSKVPELLDTVFLVLQQKPVIFLHWFHHVTVLLYCWHAYTVPVGTAPGLWFASINFAVHSIMYLYYFLSISGGTLRRFARPLAPFITAIQLTQMVCGSTFIATAAYFYESGGGCAVHPSNYRLGLAMYLSYFVLFGVLFYNLYLRPGGKHAKPSDQPDEEKARTICGVEMRSADHLQGDDSAGFFHGRAGQDRRVSSYQKLTGLAGGKRLTRSSSPARKKKA